MKAEFLVENIENFLLTLSKILPLHSQIPVLSNILIEVEDEGLFISATNLEVGIRIKIPAKTEAKGAITVPGKQFIEVISTLSKDKVSISLEKDEKIDFVATDGFRLSLKKIIGKNILKGQKSLIIPAKIITDALSLKGEDISMFVYEGSNQIVFETENVVLIGRIINGEFPNYERVVPASSKTKIILDKQVLEQNLRFSSVFARESANIVRFKVEGEKVKIYAKSAGLGEGEAVIDAEKSGEDNEIAFNVKFVMDILKNIESQSVIIELSSALEPAVFKTEDDQDFLHIIMPVRLQE